MAESLEQTQFGFKWGPAEVLRHIEDMGYVIMGVKTAKAELVIEVTPSGEIKAYIEKHYEDPELRLRYPKRKRKHENQTELSGGQVPLAGPTPTTQKESASEPSAT